MMNQAQPKAAPGQMPGTDATLAGNLGAAVRKLQENRNRFGGRRELQGAPIGGEAKSPAAEGARVLSAVAETRNEQNGNQPPTAPSNPGAPQGTGSPQPGQQPNVGQRQAPSSPGKGTPVPSTDEEKQKRQRMK
jgi:hypothetical protein